MEITIDETTRKELEDLITLLSVVVGVFSAALSIINIFLRYGGTKAR